MTKEFDPVLAQAEQQDDEIKEPEYSDKEKAFLSQVVRELNHAWNQRQQPYTELDDMTYGQWYLANKKAGAGYIPSKTNKEDVRTVSGITREKTNTLMAALLKYNFSHSIEAYDEKNLPSRDMGTALADMVTKSRLLESPRYEVKRPQFLQELLIQGTAFFRETYQEHYVITKKLEKLDWDKLMSAKWTEKVEVGEKYCDTQLVPGYSVYLGNIREFYIEKQPYVGLVRIFTRAEAHSLYRNWPRWKNVPKKVRHTISGTLNSNSIYEGWYLTDHGLDMVEEITYYNKWTNTYQVLLNGVMQLPVGFPLQALFGRIEYPIVKADIEPISANFAYSRGVPAKTKFNQALMDEMFRAIVLKTRKSIAPPLANNTGQMISRKVFYPGTVTDNVDPAKLQPIGDNNGVTGPEMDAIQYIKGLIDASSVNPLFEGQGQSGEQTAREIMELQKQSIMRLGLTIIGIMNMEAELVWKRLWNIIKNWTDPIDYKIEKVKGQMKEKNVYRTETVESEFENGQRGQRIIDMDEGPFPHSKQIKAEENLLSFKRDMPVRKIYIDPRELQKLKYKLFVKINPTEKDPSELKAIMFEESLMKAMQIFPESINRDYAKQQWAIHQKLDPDKLFVQNTPVQPPMPGQPGQAGIAPRPGSTQQAPITSGSVGAQALPQSPRKQSLKALVGAK